jgi:hypothetical protein
MIGITIRINGATDSIKTQDGRVIDRSTMTNTERNTMRRIVRGIYEKHLEIMNG